jgi:glutathione S-transferase
MKPVLAIGNLNYSSWSLRAWLSMRFAKIDFDELLIDLDQPGYGEARIAQVLAVSPSGRVPALKVGEEQIWDTIGIAMWALEQASSRGQQANLLPASQASRNLMWSVIGEMHSGFAALRRELTMNLIRRCQAYGLSKEALADIERVDQLWRQCREGHANAGPYLFGTRSLADAFFVPVATRFRTYKIALSASAQSYADCLLSDPDFRVWEDRVLAGPAPSFSRANHDHVYADPAPADSATRCV